MRLLPDPGDLLKLPTAGIHALGELISLMPRITDLVGAAERLLRRVNTLIDGVEEVQARASAVVDSVSLTDQRADAIVSQTAGVVQDAEGLVRRVDPLLAQFEPVLAELAPIVERLVGTTSPDEVSAIVKLIDTTPTLVDKLDKDILPILDTLGTVAPDVRDLLDISRQLNAMLAGVPGLGRIKKRMEEEQEDEGTFSYRAEEEPPSAPERKT